MFIIIKILTILGNNYFKFSPF
jgi:hypothetical protein